MSKDWRRYAQHILDVIEKIARIRQRGDITEDDILYDAALRNLQTQSEATQRLPDSKKSRYPDIPWRQICGFRNILVHDVVNRYATPAPAASSGPSIRADARPP